MINDDNNNNLIHLTILNPNKFKSEFNKLNFIKFLVQNNIDPNQANKENQTPLHLACEKQYLDIVSYLLTLYIDVNYQDNNGYTPLHYLLMGKIFPYKKLSIKDIIIPKKNNNYILDNNLLELKKLIWNGFVIDKNNPLYTIIRPTPTPTTTPPFDGATMKEIKGIKDDDLFKILKNSIELHIQNNVEYKEQLIKYNEEIVKYNNDNKNLILTQNNFRQKLKDIAEKEWNEFLDSEEITYHKKEIDSYPNPNIKDYAIIKNYDIKKIIKNKLKDNINNGTKLIEDYNVVQSKKEHPIFNFNLTDELKQIITTILSKSDYTSIAEGKPDKNNTNRIIYTVLPSLVYNDFSEIPVMPLAPAPAPIVQNPPPGFPVAGLNEQNNTYSLEFTDVTKLNVLTNNSKINDLNDIYTKNRHPNAKDNADNIIEMDKLSFIGGSRKIKINYMNYSNEKDYLNTTPTILNLYNIIPYIKINIAVEYQIGRLIKIIINDILILFRNNIIVLVGVTNEGKALAIAKTKILMEQLYTHLISSIYRLNIINDCINYLLVDYNDNFTILCNNINLYIRNNHINVILNIVSKFILDNINPIPAPPILQNQDFIILNQIHANINILLPNPLPIAPAPVPIIITNIIYSFIINITQNYIIDKIENYINDCNNLLNSNQLNKGNDLYYKYILLLSTVTKENKLEFTIPILFFDICNALNNDSRLNKFQECLTKIHAVKIRLPPLGPINSVQDFINILFNNDNSTNNIAGLQFDNTKDNKELINKILDKYYNLDVKFSKIYLYDLIYYILNPKSNIILINNELFSKPPPPPPPPPPLPYFDINSILNIKLNINNIKVLLNNNELPPSLQGWNYVNQESEFEIYKFIECIHLNLFFNGCLPELLTPVYYDNYYYQELLPQWSDYIKLPVFYLNLSDKTNNTILIFNPLHDELYNPPALDINQYNADQHNQYSTPLPFNYYYTSRLEDYDFLDNRFQYIKDQYRPPYIKSYESLQINNFIKCDELLQKELGEFNNIFKSLFDKKKISKIYNESYVKTKTLFYKQEKIVTNLSNYKNIELFKFNDFVSKLNSINSYIFFYYLFYKKKNNIPEFIYYKLNSDNYYLYNNNGKIDLKDLNKLTGGAYNSSDKNADKSVPTNDKDNKDKIIKNEDSKKEYITNIINDMKQFYNDVKIRIKQTNPYLINNNLNPEDPTLNISTPHIYLPPSIEDNLYDFYDLSRKKIIIDYFSKNIYFNKNNDYLKSLKDITNLNIKDNDLLKKYNIAKLIEEIIKDYSYNELNNSINDLIRLNANKDIILPITKYESMKEKPYLVTRISSNTINTIKNLIDCIDDDDKLKHLINYKTSTKDINKKCDFIVYPNEYSNTTLLNQKYCIFINKDIIEKLFENNEIQPYLVDNNNSSIIYSILKIYHYDILTKIKDLYSFNFSDYERLFIENEFNNHKNKILVLENNEIDYIKTINNFIEPQYDDIKNILLSDDSYGFNILFNLKQSFKICFYTMNEYFTDYIINDTNILKLLDYNKPNICESYLNNISNNNLVKLKTNYKQLIHDEYEDYLDKQKMMEMDDYTDICFKYNREYYNKIIEYNNKIELIKTNMLKFDISDISGVTINNDVSIPNEKIDNEHKIIKIYNYISISHKDTKYLYSLMWDLLLDDNNLLKNSPNLSLIKILNEKEYMNYFNKVAKLGIDYFEKDKYIKNNQVLSFIYELLVHLTKTVLCFGIENIIYKVLSNYLTNKYVNYNLEELNAHIKRIFTNELMIKENESSTFKQILYNEISIKFVKNSVSIFNDIYEEKYKENESVLDILQNLFNLIKYEDIDEEFINLINKNIAEYFDLFVKKTINNWFVVCENTLKFVINHDRITKTLNIIKS
jgi:hypothetical protein